MSLEPSTDVVVRMSLRKGDFTPPLNVVAGRPQHHSFLPTLPKIMSSKMTHDTVLDCFFDGNVWLSGLDVDTRCICGVQVDDVSCGNNGSEELIDAEVDNDVCVTDGDVGFSCLDVLIGCLGCIRKPR